MERSVKSWVLKNIPRVLYFFGFLCVWQLLVVVFRIKEFIIPSPIRVFEHLFNLRPNRHYDWFKHIQATVLEVAVSFVVTAVIGIIMAISISWSKLLSKIFMPLIILFNSLPKIALAPLFLLWFGYGFIPNVFMAFLVAFFPVVINSTVGLNAVEDDLLNLVKYLNASKFQIFIKIRIPNSLPYFFAGIKISATMCVVGSIVGEFLASEKGLGYQLRDAQAFIDTPTMFACLLLLSVIGSTFFSCIQFIEKISMPWNNWKG
jgi:NitT/TauT family transport system permease protein